MDINDLRSLVTVISFIVFLGILAWTWSARRRAGFEAAAQLPFTEEARDGHRVEEGS
ncbi:MAG: cbb3-type cytochrome c oxidase subunit 3 [Burkholderiaceae bacterium]